MGWSGLGCMGLGDPDGERVQCLGIGLETK